MVKLRNIKKEDGEFVLSIRNDPSTLKYLHDRRTFNINQFNEWYDEYHPNWMIILNENNIEVGYLRTKWINFPDHLEIGIDIHPEFRNLGYAKSAYSKAFKHFKSVKKFSLEVFRENTVAFNLYIKLGFVQKSISQIGDRISVHMEKNVNKFLILICYYNRPNLVRYALSSLKNQSYKNWQALVVDDGSDISCEDSIKEILREEATKVKYINTLMSKKDKESIGGSLFGLYWNHACIAYDCDFAIMLCDDDALMPDYLENLNKFFQENLNRKWIYSHVKYYDPFCQTDFKNIKTCMEVNQPIYELNPDSRLDASQVAFSLDAFKTYGAEFGYPLTANLDSDLYRKLHPVYGNCCFSGFFSQYKGYASSRLETRQFNAESIYSNNIDVNIDPAQEN